MPWWRISCKTAAALLHGLAAAGVLHIFFRSVRHRWPEHYSTLRGVLESYVSQGLGRYIAFRTLPVYLAGIFTAITVDRLDLNAGLALIIMGLVHLTATNGRAALTATTSSAKDPRPRGLLLTTRLSAPSSPSRSSRRL